MTIIRGQHLETFDVAPDGRTLSINVTDDRGEPSSLVLPSDYIRHLIMTLPRIARQVLQRRYRDSSLRIAYPVAGWDIETSGDTEALILTLRTADGFAVSFVVSQNELKRMTDTAANPDPVPVTSMH